MAAKRWFAVPGERQWIWEWDPRRHVGRWVNPVDGSFAEGSRFSIAEIAGQYNGREIVPDWSRPELRVPEGL